MALILAVVLLAVALVLQTYDGVSDEEAKQRADYDLRWKVALGVELDARPFAKSTLQEFRAQLVIPAWVGFLRLCAPTNGCITCWARR